MKSLSFSLQFKLFDILLPYVNNRVPSQLQFQKAWNFWKFCLEKFWDIVWRCTWKVQFDFFPNVLNYDYYRIFNWLISCLADWLTDWFYFVKNSKILHLYDKFHFQEKQSRIAALYLPLLTTILEHTLRFHKSLDRPFIDDSLLSTRPHVISPSSDRASPAPSRNSMVSSTPTNYNRESQEIGNKNNSFVPFDEDEKRELLLCMVFILKTLSSGTIQAYYWKLRFSWYGVFCTDITFQWKLRYLVYKAC